MTTALSVEDQLAIQNLLARYTFLMDDGDEAWASLFTEDGVLAGVGPGPISGIDNLKKVPVGAMARNQGRVKHLNSNILIEAGAASDQARVRAYSLVSSWPEDGGKLQMMADYAMDLVKRPDGWRFRSVTIALIR